VASLAKLMSLFQWHYRRTKFCT